MSNCCIRSPHVANLYPVLPSRCTEESRALKTDLSRTVESGLTCNAAPQVRIVDIARLPLPSDCNTTFFPRSSSSFQDGSAILDDVEYLEYEQHVAAQARAAHNQFGAPGGRHAWKTLIFWKRRRTGSATASTCGGLRTPSAASTPMRTPGRRAGPVAARCHSSQALYCSDGFDSTMAIRAWYEPSVRKGKLVSFHEQEYCNRSPYVPLSARRPARLASPGPLYLV